MAELVKVGSESKYIDLMVDWSFKKIFGTEVNEDRTNYIKSMNTERDTYNQIEYARETGREEGREEGHKVGKEEGLKEGLKEGREEGHKEGKEEGIKEGREEGAKQKSFDIAKRMLEKGIETETISELTGLTEKEISELDRTKSR